VDLAESVNPRIDGETTRVSARARASARISSPVPPKALLLRHALGFPQEPPQGQREDLRGAHIGPIGIRYYLV
jgi:hypothetical protein